MQIYIETLIPCVEIFLSLKNINKNISTGRVGKNERRQDVLIKEIIKDN